MLKLGNKAYAIDISKIMRWVSTTPQEERNILTTITQVQPLQTTDYGIDDEDVTTNNLGLAIFNDIDDLSILDDNMQVEQSSPVLSSNPPDTCSDNPELSANHILHPNEDVYIHNVLYRKEDVEICTPSPNAGTPIGLFCLYFY